MDFRFPTFLFVCGAILFLSIGRSSDVEVGKVKWARDLEAAYSASSESEVVRFLDKKGEDIIPRRDRIRTTEALATRMAEALGAGGRPVPEYLEALGALSLEQNLGAIVEKLDLSPVQSTKVNAHLRTETRNALRWLSPRQIAHLEKE